MWQTATWARQLRVHQWLKNLLLALPALASFSLFESGTLVNLLFAFFAFSFVASSVYIANDFLDLANDRIHAVKRSRPMAAGLVNPSLGLVIGSIFLALGLVLAYFVGQAFLLSILVYLAANFMYSLWLKREVLIDAILLAGLYTLRVIAGGLATEIEVSFWLLAFSVFFFFSIAWAKRYAELEASRAADRELAPGRGYSHKDMPIILAFGSAAAFTAVLIFALYLDSESIREQYAFPQIGWLAIPFLMLLIGRMWFKAHRGRLNEDPILFFIKDVPTLAILAIVAAALWIAHAGIPPWS
jgi:4-hydroxybenzoate polyprenyltransferase